jgi:hypothetical protein
MRTLRLSLAGTVILALLGGLGGVATAQVDAEHGPATPFTGAVQSTTVDTSEEVWSVEGDIGHARIFKTHEIVEWSDPRLPTDKLNVLNFDMYDIGEFRQTPISGTMLLEDQDGYWTGTFTSFCDADGECHGMNVLTGHGDHEGLFAVFRASPPRDPETEEHLVLYEGLIFEGEMPPMPDAIEPASD